jgi:hypothetical protein
MMAPGKPLWASTTYILSVLLSCCLYIAHGYAPICSISGGEALAAGITARLINIFTGITADVELMKTLSPTFLADVDSSAYLTSSTMYHDREVVVNNDHDRLLDLFYGTSARDDIYNDYVDGRTIDTDLIAIQAVSKAIPVLVERRRKRSEQYYMNVTTLVAYGEPSVVVDGFIITGNDIWSMYPSIPLQDMPTCKGLTSLCMKKPLYLNQNTSSEYYYVNGTYGDYLGPDPASNTLAFYTIVEPENDASRAVAWTEPYVYSYANLISCVAPLYLTGTVDGYTFDDTFFGTIGLDISISGISEFLTGFDFTKVFIQFVMDYNGLVVIMRNNTAATVFGENHTEDFFSLPIMDQTTSGSTDWRAIYDRIINSATSSGHFNFSNVEFPLDGNTITSKGHGKVQDAYIFFNRWDDQVPRWISVFITPKEQVDNALQLTGDSSATVYHNGESSADINFDYTFMFVGSLVTLELGFSSALPAGVSFVSTTVKGITFTNTSRYLGPGQNITVRYSFSDTAGAESGTTVIPVSVVGLSDNCQSDSYKKSLELNLVISSRDRQMKPYMLIIVVVAVIAAFLVFASYVIGRMNLARRIALKDLLIHRSLYDGVPDNLILHYLQLPEHVRSAKLRDYDKRTALEIALNHSKTTSLILYKLLIDSMPFSLSRSVREGVRDNSHIDNGNADLDEDGHEHNYAWATIVQSVNERAVEVVGVLLSEYPSLVGRLSQFRDRKQRLILDIASPPCKELLMRGMYLHRRYEIISARPEHRSDSSLVMLAIDHVPVLELSSSETASSERLNLQDPTASTRSTTAQSVPFDRRIKRRVALKFMIERDQFQAELVSRSMQELSSEFVVELLAAYDSEHGHDADFFEDARGRGYEGYGYCVVLAACDESLKRVVDGQNIVGDMEEVSRMFRHIVSSVQHIHDRGILHGDLKRKCLDIY